MSEQQIHNNRLHYSWKNMHPSRNCVTFGNSMTLQNSPKIWIRKSPWSWTRQPLPGSTWLLTYW